jgi:hypothetical protein
MGALLADGRILDWILGGMVLEAVCLVAIHRFLDRGIPPASVLPNLASGMCVILAMRLALGGAWWGFASAALLGALAFHVADLTVKWR